MYYAIEITGYGKRQRFNIKKVIGNGTYPFNCVGYGSLEDALKAAKENGLEIKAIGDIWQIINKEAK